LNRNTRQTFPRFPALTISVTVAEHEPDHVRMCTIS